MFHVGDHKQLWAGLFFFLLGIGTLVDMPSEIGTAADMGPGYIPMLLGICLVLLGGTSMVVGARSHERVRVSAIPIRTVALILSGVLVFAALINVAGLAVSLLCLLLISCANRLRHNAIEIGVMYLILLGMTWFIFIRVIQLPMRLF